MRFLCRDDHSIERWPPHRFDGGWQNSGDGAAGIIYCRWCGDIREAAPPTIGPALDELSPPLHTRTEGQGGS